jgi:hypothetical protein
MLLYADLAEPFLAELLRYDGLDSFAGQTIIQHSGLIAIRHAGKCECVKPVKVGGLIEIGLDVDVRAVRDAEEYQHNETGGHVVLHECLFLLEPARP